MQGAVLLAAFAVIVAAAIFGIGALEKERVMDRDRFANLCGEAGRLRKLLRRLLNQLLISGQPDNAVPTLTERIDLLESLLKREAHQVADVFLDVPARSSCSF
jgi:hypothetical protein